MASNDTAREVTQRIRSIDAMRGLVMLIMLMDHVREHFYFHHPVTDPMDLPSTSTALFLSRFAAHICAPAFVFLTGLSAWIYQNGNTHNQRELMPFLLKRGLFLIVLELTLVTYSWMGTYQTIWLQVIWAIGLSMIALALLHKLNRPWLFAIAFTIIAGHNLLTPIHFTPHEWGYSLWTILHDRGYLISDGALRIKVSYPLLPWIGVIICGYLTGPLFSAKTAATSRQVFLLGVGGICLTLFLLLRGFNFYGETLEWQFGANTVQTIMSILNLTKYPPSLSFLLITLGITCLILVLLEKYNRHKVIHILSTIGSAPLFFYLLHLYVLLLAYQLALHFYGANHGELFCVNHIRWIWGITILLGVVLYWPTKMFAKFKQSSSWKWVRYF